MQSGNSASEGGRRNGRVFCIMAQGNNNVTFNRRKVQTERQPLDLEGYGHYNTEITHTEIQCTISAMEKGSPRPDEITYSMIKQAHIQHCKNSLSKYIIKF